MTDGAHGGQVGKRACHFENTNTDGMIARSMNIQRRRTTGEPTALIFTLLALVALIGLLMGILTHTLLQRQGAISQIIAARTSTPTTTQSAAIPTETATTQPKSTATTASNIGHFQLNVTVSPKTVKAGQQVTITVSAFDPNSHAAIEGLPCLLRQPIDGSPSFLSTWPTAQTTDASGATSWTLTAPTKKTGTYEIEAFAKTSDWSWKADTTIQLSAS